MRISAGADCVYTDIVQITDSDSLKALQLLNQREKKRTGTEHTATATGLLIADMLN